MHTSCVQIYLCKTRKPPVSRTQYTNIHTSLLLKTCGLHTSAGQQGHRAAASSSIQQSADTELDCMASDSRVAQTTMQRGGLDDDDDITGQSGGGCSSFFRQFSALVRKNFLTKRRSKCQLVSKGASSDSVPSAVLPSLIGWRSLSRTLQVTVCCGSFR